MAEKQSFVKGKIKKQWLEEVGPAETFQTTEPISGSEEFRVRQKVKQGPGYKNRMGISGGKDLQAISISPTPGSSVEGNAVTTEFGLDIGKLEAKFSGKSVRRTLSEGEVTTEAEVIRSSGSVVEIEGDNISGGQVTFRGIGCNITTLSVRQTNE